MARGSRAGVRMKAPKAVACRCAPLGYHCSVFPQVLQRRHLILGVAVCIVGAVTLATAFGPCTQDDTFISLRYAHNLVEGHGLVYNPGEYVEGYSNLAWTLLLALPLYWGADPVTSSTLLGLFHLVAAVAAAGGLGVAAVGRSPWALLPAVLVAIDPFGALEAVEGLETTLYMAVVTAGFARLVVELAPERGPLRVSTHVGSSVVFALAATVRPEAPLLPALAHLGLVMHAVATRAHPLKRIAASAVAGVPIAVMLVVLSVWRVTYYGDLLPNTFYAKTGGMGWEAGWSYIRHHGVGHPGLWLAAFGGLPLALRSRPGAALSAACVGFVLYVASVGGDFKPTGRFILPVTALLATVGAVGLRQLPPRVGMAALLGVVGATGARLPDVMRQASEWADIRHANLAARQLVGEFLRAQLPPDSLIAIHSAGAIPYYARLPTIDMWGLTDRHIARAPIPEHGIGLVGHERGDPAYVFGRNPVMYLPEDKLFTLRAWPLEPEPGFPSDFTSRYESVTIPLEGRFLNVWMRKGFLAELHRGDYPDGPASPDG